VKQIHNAHFGNTWRGAMNMLFTFEATCSNFSGHGI
jgi:hypothetical protein